MDDNGAPRVLEPIFLSPDVVYRMLGISRSELFRLLRAGEIESFRHGKRRLISRASVEAWAETRLSEASRAEE